MSDLKRHQEHAGEMGLNESLQLLLRSLLQVTRRNPQLLFTPCTLWSLKITLQSMLMETKK